MKQSDITHQVRAMTGLVAEVISDEDLGYITTAALNEYLGYRPQLQLTTAADAIVTVTDQPNYDLPEDALWIATVAWDPDALNDEDETLSQLYMDLVIPTVSAMHPSEMYVADQRLTEWRKRFGGSWRLVNRDGTDEIWLVPEPTDSGTKVAVVYAKARTVADLKAVKDRLFLDLIVGYMWARMASEENGDTDWRAGVYAKGPGGAQGYARAADRLLGRTRHILACTFVADHSGPGVPLRAG